MIQRNLRLFTKQRLGKRTRVGIFHYWSGPTSTRNIPLSPILVASCMRHSSAAIFFAASQGHTREKCAASVHRYTVIP
jgi:hypothetical protein